MAGEGEIRNAADSNLSGVLHSESSLSSGVISLPSANRLADISLTSDLTDSEAENEATLVARSSAGGDHGRSFEKYKKSLKNSLTVYGVFPYSEKSFDSRTSNPIISNHQSEMTHSDIRNESCDKRDFGKKSVVDFHSKKDGTESKDIANIPNIPINDVKTALQENSSMLTDRHLLNDLFKSLDDNYKQKPESNLIFENQRFDKNQDSTSDQQDPFKNSMKEIYKQTIFNSSITRNTMSLSNQCVSNPNFNQGKSEVNENKSYFNPKTNIQNPTTSETFPDEYPLLNPSPVNHQLIHEGSTKETAPQSVGKHVKFESTPRTQDENDNIKKVKFGSQESLAILKKLSELRWGLMGWEEVSVSPPTESTTSLSFVNKLLNNFQALQMEKQHLKEELSITLKNLNELRKDYVIKQRMYEKRETRLLEADKQLEELQLAWAAAQEAKQKETVKLMSQCHLLKKENTFLKMESKSLKSDMSELKTISHQHTLMKTRVLEMEELLAERTKKITEIMDENKRLNICVEENQKHLRELEEVKVQCILSELENAKTRAGKLEMSNRELSEAKAHLQEDLHMLQEQHHLLLRKTVEEQEKNSEAEKSKSLLEEELKSLSAKMTTMKTQLHLHYQTQVEDLVAKKSSVLQEQLKALESSLQKNHEEQINAQNQAHEEAVENLRKRYEEEIMNVKSCYESQVEKFRGNVKKLEEENQHLHQQKEKIISTMSSVLGLEHQTDGKPTGSRIHSGDINREAGSVCSSLDIVKDRSTKPTSLPTSGSSVGNPPYLSLQSSSSSDSDSTVFHEGKQTVREKEYPILSGSISLNSTRSHLSNQRDNLIPSVYSGGNTRERQSQSVMYTKENNPQTQGTSSCMYSEREGDMQSRSDLKCNKNYLGHDKALYPLSKQKIWRASEIIQGSDLTDGDGCDDNRGRENRFFSPEDDEEMNRILKELRMVTQNTVRSGTEPPTHDTSLDLDPASLTLHRLSQVSSVLSQYVTNS